MLVRSAVRLIAVGSLDADVARVSPVRAQMWQRDALAMRCGPTAVGYCGHTAGRGQCDVLQEARTRLRAHRQSAIA